MGLPFCLYFPHALPWWANALFLVALCQFCADRRSVALRLAVAAVVLAASHLVIWDRTPPPGPAYYVWAGSMVLLVIATASARLAETDHLGQAVEWNVGPKTN
jgi:hypothetical protein